jgi:hypothetical protein
MDLRSGIEKRHSGGEVQRSTFARFSGSLDFRLFATVSGAKRTSRLGALARFFLLPRIAALEADATAMKKPLTIVLVEHEDPVISWLITTVEVPLQ